MMEGEGSLKLIAWDFDGTLVDSRPLIEAGLAHALDALGQPRSVMAEWLKYVGLPVEDGIRNTFEPLGRVCVRGGQAREGIEIRRVEGGQIQHGTEGLETARVSEKSGEKNRPALDFELLHAFRTKEPDFAAAKILDLEKSFPHTRADGI